MSEDQIAGDVYVPPLSAIIEKLTLAEDTVLQIEFIQRAESYVVKLFRGKNMQVAMGPTPHAALHSLLEKAPE